LRFAADAGFAGVGRSRLNRNEKPFEGIRLAKRAGLQTAMELAGIEPATFGCDP
jgi:hypothetical protein